MTDALLPAIASHTVRPGLPLDTLVALTALAIAPFAVIMTTSFVRIVIVLSLVRSAIGASSLPPNAVITGLALVLSFTIMTPAIARASHDAFEPYGRGAISERTMLARAFVPLHDFMLRQTHVDDIALFARVAHEPLDRPAAAPPQILLPAYVVGELRSAFAIGFALYLPFVAIDLAVASILMGLGMFMLSPPIVSLPCKLLLFVMVDGWALVCGGVVSSFR